MSEPHPQGEPWQWGVVEAANAVRNNAATPTEVVQSVLARIDRVEPAIAAFVSVDRDGALARAEELTRRAAAGDWQGPLHGVPVAIKDIFDVEGHRTGCGSPLYADGPAAEADSDAVARLRAAGAVLVGKTATHELACGVYTHGTRNPWDLERSCGGSSGGSGGAVAAGLAMAATGSDTGGSIRIPAAVCGVVGIKPTYGVVSRRGVAALAWSLDHVGPIARSVDDAAAVFEVLIDPAARPRLAGAPHPGDGRLEGAVLGIPTDAILSRVLPSVLDAFEEACTVLVDGGARLVEVSVPELEETLPLEFAIVAAEAASYHAERLRTSAALIGPEIRPLFQAGAILPAGDYLLAQRLRSVLCSAVARAFSDNGLDALCTPTLPLGPWRFEDTTLEIDGVEEAVIEAAVRTTAPFNLTGLPAVSVPMGLDERALPVGLQLVGRPYLDRATIALAQAYEQRRGPLAAVTPLHRATLATPETV